MSEFANKEDLKRARIAHLVGVANYLNTATMALWGRSERAEAMLGMFEAGIRWPGPDGCDEEILSRLRDLFAEAREYHAKEEFSAMMARLRVAYDLISLKIIEVSGE